MRKASLLLWCLFFFGFSLVKSANAQSESFLEKFLGSPLLILVVLIIVAVIAMIYHKLTK